MARLVSPLKPYALRMGMVIVGPFAFGVAGCLPEVEDVDLLPLADLDQKCVAVEWHGNLLHESLRM